MARVINFHRMQFSGKIGDMVFCTTRSGETYIRKRASSSTEPTTKQLAMRMRFKLASKFLIPLIELIKVTWPRNYKKPHSELNRSMSAMIREAFVGQYPDIEINYPMVPLSKGRIQPPVNLKTHVENSTLLVSWLIDWQIRNNDRDDEVSIVVVDPRTSAVELRMGCALRGDGETSLNIPSGFSRGELHLYFIFISKYGKFCSDTEYRQIIY